MIGKIIRYLGTEETLLGQRVCKGTWHLIEVGDVGGSQNTEVLEDMKKILGITLMAMEIH